MSVSRSTTNVNVVSMIGTIVFKGAECTSGNVKRLRQGSNRLRVVVKLNLNIAAESRASQFQHPLIIFSDNFQRDKRRDYDQFRQQTKKKLFCDNFTCTMVLVYYRDEKMRYK